MNSFFNWNDQKAERKDFRSKETQYTETADSCADRMLAIALACWGSHKQFQPDRCYYSFTKTLSKCKSIGYRLLSFSLSGRLRHS